MKKQATIIKATTTRNKTTLYITSKGGHVKEQSKGHKLTVSGNKITLELPELAAVTVKS